MHIFFLRVGRLRLEGLIRMRPLHIHIPFAKLRDYFDLIKKRGYDLEIYFPASALDQVERPDLERLRDTLDWGPSLTLHAPFMDINAGAVDTMVKSVTQLRFRQLLNVADILRPKAAVFHSGYDRWRYAGRVDIWLENSIGTWSKVMESAKKIGMRVAVENVFDETPDALGLLIERMSDQDFGFCFDLGHFNIFSKAPMEQWFETLGGGIIELHLHDNDGREDSHWAVGKGTIDFAKFFRLLGGQPVQPIYTIEAHDKDDVDASIERVRALLQET